LYRIEQDEVWKKVMVNDSLLKEFYDAHKENYQWPERVNFAEIYTELIVWQSKPTGVCNMGRILEK